MVTRIHLIGGEKGGVGKSFVCRAVVAYLIRNGLEFELFDADRTTADVFRIYGKAAGCRQVVFSEADHFDDAANVVFNTALDGRRVVVNLPAQSMPALSQWISDNELFEVAADSDVEFVSWFVSDCGLDSLSFFSDLLDLWGESMQHVFVANYGKTLRWDRMKADKALMDRMKEMGVKVVKFPKFIGQKNRDLINEMSMTYEQAKVAEVLGPIGRQNVKSFLRKSSEAFEKVGVFASAE